MSNLPFVPPSYTTGLVTGPYCANCVQQPCGIGRVEPDGQGNNGVMLVGDSPWKDEQLAKKPFSGAAGTYLNAILQKRHHNRFDFTITNIMNCSPPHLGWSDHPERYPAVTAAQQQCESYLKDTIASRKPRSIVALGNVALRRLTGFTSIEENHGYVCDSIYNIPTVATFHPSHIVQGAHKLTLAFILAIERALEIANGTYRATHYNLYEDPSLEQLNNYLNKVTYSNITRPSYPWRPTQLTPATRPDDFLMCDIETPESDKMDEEKAEDDASYTIVRMGFSNQLNTGCSFPFEGAYIARAKEAVWAARQLLFWNKNYDLPRLRAAGFRIHPDCKVIDAMWAWHFYQSDLPKALAFAAPFFYSGPPWKHLSSRRPAYYNAMDNAVQTSCWLGIKAELQREGRLDRFMRHAVECEAILVNMGDHGVTVDIGEREKFKQSLQADAQREHDTVQALLPSTFSTNKVKKWKRQPKDMLNVRRSADGGWERPIPFNLNAWQQIIPLIEHYKLKVPKKRGADRPTTEKKYLMRFGKKYPIFDHIVRCKERRKLVSTYMWPLDTQCRAHTQYGFHPSTWRLSSRKVNLQNIPKRSDIAAQFRGMLTASPGHMLVEADGSAIEAVLVGYSAGSEAYIRLAKAGIHAWLMSHVIKQPLDWQMPFDELRAACKKLKKTNAILYDGCKHIIHGGNFLFTPYGVYDEFQELFESERQVNELMKLYFSLPPGLEVRAYQKRQIETAHLTKQLRNHFDCIHYFYDLFTYNKRTKRDEHGEDAKRAVAFVPQSDAAFIQREEFLDIKNLANGADSWLLPFLCLPTHDSVAADVPPDLIEPAAKVLHRIMTKKWAELGGLDIGVEIKVGPNLRDQEEIHFK